MAVSVVRMMASVELRSLGSSTVCTSTRFLPFQHTALMETPKDCLVWVLPCSNDSCLRTLAVQGVWVLKIVTTRQRQELFLYLLKTLRASCFPNDHGSQFGD